MSTTKNLSVSEIIQRHTAPIYTISFLGFLPGFLYLSGLDAQLFIDRKTAPNLNIKKGAVAIGGTQTGIYPKQSPGGWHIIGNTPIDLFNIKQEPPSPFKAGDTAKFVPIDSKTHHDIRQKVKLFDYTLTPTPLV
jgi:inhibitor of KinA